MAQVPVEAAPSVTPNVAPLYQEPNTNFSVPRNAFGQDIGSAMQGAAKGLMDAANDAGNIAIQQAQATTQTRITQADAAYRTGANNILFGDGTPDNPGYNSLQGQAKIDAAPGVISALNANRDSAQGMLSDQPQPAQDFYNRRTSEQTSDAIAQVSSGLGKARNDVSLQASNGRMFAATQTAGLNYSDPMAVAGAFEVARQETASMAKITGLPPDAAAEQLAINQGGVAQTIIKSALANDPSGAAAAAVSKQFPTLPADVTASINNAVMAAQQRAQAAGRATLGAKIDDNLASIGRTGAPIHFGISPAQVVAVFGPQQGAVINQKIADTTGLYQAQQSAALTNPTEDAATLAKMQPGSGGVSGTYAEQAATADAFQRALQQKYTMLNKDPAGYLYQANPGYAAQVDGAKKDPTLWPQVAAESDRLYDKLGLPPQNRPVMPAPVAQGFVANLMQLPPEQQAQSFSDNLAAIPDDATRGRVQGDLVRAGLPPSFETLAAMPNSADQTAFAGTIGKGPVLRAGLAPGDAKAIDNGLANDTGLADLKLSFSAMPGGPVKADNLSESLKPLAYSFRAQGMTNDEAAARAAHSLTGAYDFYENGGQVARVPAGDLSAVEQQSATVLNGLTAPQIAVPPNPSGIDLTADQRQAIALQDAQRGFWVTNAGGTGLIRMGRNGNPVKLSGGGRLTMPFPSQPQQPAQPGMPPPDMSSDAFVPVSQ
jgi:hypothetical protein